MKNTTAIGIQTLEVEMTGTLEERIEKGIKAAKEHWMVTDSDEQFEIFLGALLLSYPEESEERERIKTEINQLKHLSAMMSGISVNIPETPEGFEPIGLMGKWKAA